MREKRKDDYCLTTRTDLEKKNGKEKKSVGGIKIYRRQDRAERGEQLNFGNRG